jgi:hypothetical protein
MYSINFRIEGPVKIGKSSVFRSGTGDWITHGSFYSPDPLPINKFVSVRSAEDSEVHLALVLQNAPRFNPIIQPNRWWYVLPGVE